jgi:hypothetical protein
VVDGLRAHVRAPVSGGGQAVEPTSGAEVTGAAAGGDVRGPGAVTVA